MGLSLNLRLILQGLKPELRKRYNVSNIGLFGSVVRDDFEIDSDIDIIVEFDKQIGIEFIDLANFLEDKLQHKIDLVSRKGIKDKYFKQIQNDIVYV